MIYLTLFWMVIGIVFFFGGIYVQKHPYSQIKNAYSYRLKKMATPETVEQYAKKTANAYKTTGIAVAIACLGGYGLQSSAFLMIGLFIAFFYLSLSITYWKKLILKKVPYWQLAAISFFFLLFFLFLGMAYQEPSARIEKGKITFTGIYGETLPIPSFSQVFLADTLPSIGMRMNGISLGNIHKGYFYSNSLHQNVKILLHSDSPPYLYLLTRNRYIILNFRDTNKTIEIYTRLKGYLTPYLAILYPSATTSKDAGEFSGNLNSTSLLSPGRRLK